ncbi:MAG: DNA internalization-related competence protein ComEC/Rec2 [Gammaproteobacteria bacterium]
MHSLPALPGTAWCVPVLLAVLLVLRARWAWPLLAFAAACVWTVLAAETRVEQRMPPAAAGDYELSGSIDTFPTLAPGQATFGFTVDAARPRSVPPRLRLTWYDAPADLAGGDAFRFTVRLRSPHGARNPGGFDYEQWLLVNGYGATGYVRGAARLPARTDLAATWLKFRATLAARLVAAAPDDDGAALIAALALGERYLFSDQHWADFRRTGTSHLVAVSGMHVALLGLLAFVAVRRTWLRLPMPFAAFDLEAAAAVSVVATAYYAALTGFAVPAERSLLMICVALLVLVSRRRVGAWQVLAATLLIVLMLDPFASLAASFWLSFVAVAILLALEGPRRLRVHVDDRWRRGWLTTRAFVALQWSISLALLPVTAWYFGEISLVGPLVNLVAIPLFNLVLVPLTVLASVAFSFESLVAIATPAVTLLCQFESAVVGGLHAVAVAPGAALPMPLPPWPAFALAACGVAFAVGGQALPGRRLAWFAVVPMFVPAVAAPREGAAHALVLDVGQGLAVLVETRTHRLLFDTGPAFRSGFDSGADIVLPALAANGRHGLDVLIVSHADNDHAGGAAAVVAAFPSVAVLHGPDVAKLAGETCERGQSWQWDGVEFRMLHPTPNFAPRGNESSCVLKVTAAGGSLLITGDIERRGEAAVLEADPGATDVVVVPHHGSATSSSAALVAALRARHAVVSAGFANRWAFPRAEVTARWQRGGAAVAVTADAGAVSIDFTRDGVAIGAEREVRHHYWQAPSQPKL